MFVFITPDCIKEAQNGGILKDLHRFKQKVENAPQGAERTMFTPFPPPFLVKKKFGGRQGRLITATKSVNVAGIEYDVLVFLCYMTRSNTDYGRFYEDPKSVGDQYLSRINIESIQTELAERLKEAPPAPLPHLNVDQESYLYSGKVNHAFEDEMVCESEEWVEEIQKSTYEYALSSICETLINGLEPDRKIGSQELSVQGRPEWKILASYFPAQKKWFLVGIDGEGKGFDSLRKKYVDLLGPDDLDETSDFLTQRTRRIYAHNFLADWEYWREVQKNPLGNFALSGEENTILEKQENLFPLFINGRAGSGKSTVLQYLYTDYLCRYLENSSVGAPPAYVTCNSQLLENAKKLVKALMDCNNSIRDKFGDKTNEAFSDKNIDDVLGKSFLEFHSYLLSLVPEKYKDRFQKDKYIGYSQFKALWKKQGFAKEKRRYNITGRTSAGMSSGRTLKG